MRDRTVTDTTPHNASTYSNHGCRCDTCRGAARAKATARRRRLGIPTIAEHVAALPRIHGSISRYQKGCRCGPCREASRAARARYRARARAAAS